MAAYGIIPVPLNWDDTMPILFEEDDYLAYSDDIEENSRALLMDREGAIIGEVEITADFNTINVYESVADPAPPRGLGRIEEFPPDGEEDYYEGVQVIEPDDRILARTYRLPYRVLRSPAQMRPIPADTLKVIMNEAITWQGDEQWIPVDEATYQALVREWENT
jgi:hypothetical protein